MLRRFSDEINAFKQIHSSATIKNPDLSGNKPGKAHQDQKRKHNQSLTWAKDKVSKLNINKAIRNHKHSNSNNTRNRLSGYGPMFFDPVLSIDPVMGPIMWDSLVDSTHWARKAWLFRPGLFLTTTILFIISIQ